VPCGFSATATSIVVDLSNPSSSKLLQVSTLAARGFSCVTRGQGVVSNGLSPVASSLQSSTLQRVLQSTQSAPTHYAAGALYYWRPKTLFSQDGRSPSGGGRVSEGSSGHYPSLCAHGLWERVCQLRL
jgi:hypothetical protein